MASELSVTMSFTYTRGNFALLARALAALGVNVGSDPLADGVLSVTTTPIAIPLAGVVPGRTWAWLKNLDPTNFIKIFGGKAGSVATITATAASTGLIKITQTNHGFSTGDVVNISGVVGTTEANGTWVITKVDINSYTLNGSIFTNAWSSGGAGVRCQEIAAPKPGEACLVRLGADMVAPFAGADTATCSLEYVLFSA